MGDSIVLTADLDDTCAQDGAGSAYRARAWSQDRGRRRVYGMPEPGEEPRPKPNPGAFLSNWTTYDAPFATKVRLAASNTFLKLRKRQACCGNNGEPGC